MRTSPRSLFTMSAESPDRLPDHKFRRSIIPDVVMAVYKIVRTGTQARGNGATEKEHWPVPCLRTTKISFVGHRQGENMILRRSCIWLETGTTKEKVYWESEWRVDEWGFERDNNGHTTPRTGQRVPYLHGLDPIELRCPNEYMRQNTRQIIRTMGWQQVNPGIQGRVKLCDDRLLPMRSSIS